MWIVNILLLIIVLGILILVHEVGHFLVARKNKVFIYEFAIGMGPIIFSKKGKDGVLYSIRAFPIGGFCQMAGEVLEDDDEVPKDQFLCNKKAWQRTIILLAGVFFNVLLALVFFFISGLIWGSKGLYPIIGEVSPGYPMSEAISSTGRGVSSGDRIIEINNHKVRTWDKAQLILSLKHEGSYEFVIKHPDGSIDKYELTPVLEKTDSGERQVFGISLDQTEKRGVLASLEYSFVKFGSVTNSMALVIGNLFTGKLSLSALAGPVGIYGVIGESTHQGSAGAGIQYLLYIIAFLSINLAFVNTLPFPAFDGGRILFIIIEKIKGSPVNTKVENIFHTIGFILLMILMVYITFQDILRLFN